jgi:anhydro-N-acetylmuramic acid kinase
MESRLAIGLSVEPAADEIRAALVHVKGCGLDLAAASLSALTLPGGIERRNAPDATVAPISAAGPRDAPMIVCRLCEAVQLVAERAADAIEEVLVLGVLGPVATSGEAASPAVAAYLAEDSGVTTLTDFASRDRAAGGRGKPLDVLVDWLLAHDRHRSRLVVHLDSHTSITHLPAGTDASAARASEVGPGIDLLEQLVRRLSNGQERSDARGMLAVQGRQIKPLIRRWAAHPFLHRPLPKYFGPAEFSGAFIDQTVQLALQSGWSVADVLCTATHFLAACPADAVRHFLATDRALDQVTFVGKGTQNGLLLRLIEEQFRGIEVAYWAIPHLASEAYEAVSAAVLACLTLDGVQGNASAVTGASGPRLLGHITPGSKRNWQRCIEWMQRVAQRPELRAA